MRSAWRDALRPKINCRFSNLMKAQLRHSLVPEGG